MKQAHWEQMVKRLKAEVKKHDKITWYTKVFDLNLASSIDGNSMQ